MEGNQNVLQQSPIIVNQNNRRCWLLYSTGEALNYLHSTDQGKNWSNEKAAVHDSIEHYAAVIDMENIIHIIYADAEGKIIYLRGENRRWKKQLISSDKDNQANGYFSMVATRDSLHLCYLNTDTSRNRWRLVYHVKKEELWEAGKILAEGAGLSQNDAVLSAGQNNRVHMIQRILENDCYLLYYRTLDPETDLWNNPTLISQKTGNHFYPLLIEDEQNHIHSLWITDIDSEYKVVYRNRIFGGWPEGGWAQPKILGSASLTAVPLPVLLLNHRDITAYWKLEDIVFYRNSPDKGCSWSVTESYSLKNCRIIRYVENPGLDNKEKCPGLLVGEFPPYTFIPKLPGTYTVKKETAAVFPAGKNLSDQPAPEPVQQKTPNQSETLEKSFKELEGYTDHLVKHASELWKEKNAMENILLKQQQHYSTFYQFAGEKVKELNHEINSRENELADMEKKFKDTIQDITKQLKNEKIKYAKEKEQYMVKISLLTEENKKLKIKLDKFKENISYLKKELQKEEEKIQSLRKEMNQLKETASSKSSLWTKVCEIVNPSKNH